MRGCAAGALPLSCDLSHPKKGKMSGGKNTQMSVDKEHAVKQGGLTSFDLEPQEETHRGPVDTYRNYKCIAIDSVCVCVCK